MSIKHYLYGEEPRWLPRRDQSLTLDSIYTFAREVLRKVDDPPPDPGVPDLPSGLACLLDGIGDGWGVYGVGATALPGPDEGRFGYQLMLDPAWLDKDLRRRGARQPSLPANEAHWARDALGDWLRLVIPPDTVLRASLPPEPQAAVSGDVSLWPSAASVKPTLGCVGPPVTYTDPQGVTAEGFLTAGHVVPPDPTHNTVDIEQASTGGHLTVDIVDTRVPIGIGTGVAGNLQGAVDAAIIDSGGQAVSGLGPQGGAGHTAAVDRVTTASQTSGRVVGYAVWVATTASAWCDCYVVASSAGSFSDPGHSGAAVVKSSEVVGMVVGGAYAIQGCPSSLSYVQDIETITTELACQLVP